MNRFKRNIVDVNLAAANIAGDCFFKKYLAKTLKEDSNIFESFQMSKTYEIVTPESAEDGEFSDSGQEYGNKKFDSLWHIAKEIRDAGALKASSGRGSANQYTWYIGEPETEHRSGAKTTYMFHPKLTDKDAKELQKLIYMDRQKFNDGQP